MSDCPNKPNHTPCPEGYMARLSWAMRMLRTHRQIRCSGCGLFAIWVAKDAAPQVDRQPARKEQT